MQYSGMKKNLALSCKVLGIYSCTIKIQIACSSMIFKFLPRPKIWYSFKNLMIMLLVSALSFVKLLWTLWRNISYFHESRARTRHPQKAKLSHWIIHQKFTTHIAPLDQIVWRISPRIWFLTSQHVQGEYAILFPTRAPHKLF